MPKSKRNKVVNLTKAKKKDRAWKEGLIGQIRACVEDYPSLLLFRHHNMRNEALKELREELKDSSRFVLGSTKLLQVALGKTDADELRTNLSRVSERLAGHVGLLFTKLSKQEAVDALAGVRNEDFARAGGVAPREFALPAGPLSNAIGPLPHTLEPQLRKYGLPTRLNKGVVELLADTVVCRPGQRLDPNQAAILRVFNERMATFKLTPLAWWSDDGDTFEVIAEYDDVGDEDGEGGEDADDGGLMLDGASGEEGDGA